MSFKWLARPQMENGSTAGSNPAAVTCVFETYIYVCTSAIILCCFAELQPLSSRVHIARLRPRCDFICQRQRRRLDLVPPRHANRLGRHQVQSVAVCLLSNITHQQQTKQRFGDRMDARLVRHFSAGHGRCVDGGANLRTWFACRGLFCCCCLF